MNNRTSRSIDPRQLHIDEVADQFESLWRQGQVPSIRDFADSGTDEIVDVLLLIELIKIDLQYRLDCSASFPSFREIVDQYPELIEAPKNEFNALIRFWKNLSQDLSVPDALDNSLDDDENETLPSFIGRFRIQQKIGYGSFGDVFLAIDPEMNRQVAIKIPRNRIYATSKERTRFLTEARAVGSLRHPNIVTVYEVGYHEQTPFIVCDYVDGQTLGEYTADQSLSFQEKAQLIQEVALATDHAHRRQIIHRDIKPSNILVDNSGVPYLSDFGMARIEDRSITLTHDGAILGTPCYMAPEQALGSQQLVDHRADIYALGAVLYELLSGQRPFGGNTHAVLHQVRHDDPKMLTKLDDRIPKDLETICSKAMEKSAHRRYSSAAQLADDLQNFLERRPIRARPMSHVAKTMRWASRNRLSAMLIVSIAVLLTVATIVSSISAVVFSNIASKEKATNDRLEIQLSRNQLANGMGRLQQGDYTGLLQLLDSTEIARNQPQEFLSRKMLTAFWNDSFASYLGQVVGHDAAIVDLSVSPQNSLFVTAAKNGEIRVWDAQTGNPVGPVFKHSSVKDFQCRKIFLSPDGEHIASFGGDGLLTVFKWRSGKRIDRGLRYQCLPDESPFVADQSKVIFVGYNESEKTAIWSYDFENDQLESLINVAQPYTAFSCSPVQPLAALAQIGGHIDLLDLNSGEITSIADAHQESIECLRFSPDGKLLGSGSWDHRAKLWDVKTRQQRGSTIEHGEDVKGIAFSRDSNWFATASFDATVRLFDCQKMQIVGRPLQHKGPVFTIDFNSDGSQLVSGGYDNQLRIWNTSNQQLIDPQFRHQGRIARAKFMPGNDRQIVSASWDHTARVWDVGGGLRPDQRLMHQSRCWSAEFSADGRQLVTCSEEGTVSIWDTQTGEKFASGIQHGSPGSLVHAQWIPGHQQIVTSNQVHVCRWEKRETWQKIETFDIGKPVRKIRADANGRFLFCSSDVPSAYFVDLQSPISTVHEIPHSDVVTDVAISPDGKWLATACEDGVARLYDPKTLKQVGRDMIHSRYCESLAFSPDSRVLVTASRDYSIRFWNVADQSSQEKVIHPPEYVQSMTFHPNGRILAAGMLSGDVQLYDVISGQPCGDILKHALWLTSVSFSPNGRQLATASFDRTARLWSIKESLFDQELSRLRQDVWLTLGARLNNDGVLVPLHWKRWQQLRNELR